MDAQRIPTGEPGAPIHQSISANNVHPHPHHQYTQQPTSGIERKALARKAVGNSQQTPHRGPQTPRPASLITLPSSPNVNLYHPQATRALVPQPLYSSPTPHNMHGIPGASSPNPNQIKSQATISPAASGLVHQPLPSPMPTGFPQGTQRPQSAVTQPPSVTRVNTLPIRAHQQPKNHLQRTATGYTPSYQHAKHLSFPTSGQSQSPAMSITTGPTTPFTTSSILNNSAPPVKQVHSSPINSTGSGVVSGTVTCNNCKIGIASNVSIYTCLICSTGQTQTHFCVWCYTSGSAATSHNHDKAFFVTDSDLHILLPANPEVSVNLWTIRRNVFGTIWYTHKATGQRTHVKPNPNAVLQSEGLPAGWAEHKSPEGRVYFFNGTTGASRWDKPIGSLPNGWKELRTPELVRFYVNEALGLSTWDRPGEPPKPNRSPAQSPASKSSKPKSADTVKSASVMAAANGTRAVVAPKAAGGGMSKMFGKLGNARNIMKVAKLGMKLAEGDFEGAAESGFEGDEGGDDDEELGEEEEEEEIETVENGSGEGGVDDSLSQPTQQFQQTTYHEQPMVQQPVSDQTAYVQPTYEQPAYEQQAYEQQTYEQQAYEQQTYEQQAYEQQTYQQPLYGQPVGNQALYGQQPMPLIQQTSFEHDVGISQEQSALSPGQEGYPPGILQKNFQQQPQVLEHQVLYEQTTTSPPLHCEQPITYEQTDACLESSYQQPTVPISSPEAYDQSCLPGGEPPVFQPQENLVPVTIPEQPVFMEQQLPCPGGLTTVPLVEPAIIASGDMSQQAANPVNFQGPLPPEPMGATCGPSEEPAPDQFQVYANPGPDMKISSVSVTSQPDQIATIESSTEPFHPSSLQPLSPEPVTMNEAGLPVGTHPISVTPTWIGL